MKTRRLKINEPPLYFKIINAIFFTLVGITVIMPIWNITITSFATDLESYKMGFRLWPRKLSLSGYYALVARAQIWRPYLNNTIVTVTGVLGHLFLNTLGGFVLARPMFPGKRALWLFILIPIFVPFEAIIIPRYLVYKQLGLIDTLAAVAINGMVATFSIFLLKNYFAAIPRELEDSAEIDGASLFTVLRHIYLPLSTAALATIALLEMVGKWNTLFSAVIFLHTPSKYTLQMALRNLVVEQTSSFASGLSIHNNARAAGVVMAIVPMLAIYPLLQRYFIKGMLLGSINEQKPDPECSGQPDVRPALVKILIYRR